MKHVVKHVLDTCPDDMQFFNDMYDKTLLERLNALVNTPFARVEYNTAVELLKVAAALAAAIAAAALLRLLLLLVLLLPPSTLPILLLPPSILLLHLSPLGHGGSPGRMLAGSCVRDARNEGRAGGRLTGRGD